ncbi:two-component sensor histidine kinase [Collinsella sp. AGMB00827]|uniref:Sensor-like histidine kinase SenX3 n=1 Tax=Collinsella ureilytica TaxID=2869515 RepID=A0ABS7MIL3_9ACTN|nr:ATP-binding protein [Collinsella urealyticum]MBY4797205.1 two-component sensor histidine kinase [Collinsella urealyticum]
MAARSGGQSLATRVFRTMFAVALVSILLFSVVGTLYMQGRLAQVIREGLADEASIAAAALDDSSDDEGLLARLKSNGTRMTLVDPDGTVLFDSAEDAKELGNHAHRPEIADALREGRGSSRRSSSTLGEAMAYEAVRLQDGRVVRLAKEQAGLLSIFSTLIGPVTTLALVAAIAALITARRVADSIIAPLKLVDLDHPRRSVEGTYIEMRPMLDRIEKQRQELKRQMAVLADNDRMRREFTANITHELKTPLTTVSGYAELIAEGMVGSEADTRKFAGRIHREAGRLTSLVNDILTLSNLDESEHAGAGISDIDGVLGRREEIDLPHLVRSICQRLEDVATKNNVSLAAQDVQAASVHGVPRLMEELVYNLVSNAIRYNKPGGSVTVSSGVRSCGEPFVRVHDTGIGIAAEEQGKIFERFYRVDKSRSKSRGGTGLGLAIVKHAALYHKAEIELESELGKGTTITVVFPAV